MLFEAFANYADAGSNYQLHGWRDDLEPEKKTTATPRFLEEMKGYAQPKERFRCLTFILIPVDGG